MCVASKKYQTNKYTVRVAKKTMMFDPDYRYAVDYARAEGSVFSQRTSKGEIISLKNLNRGSLCQKRNRKFHKSIKQPVGYKRPYWPYEPRYTILFNHNLLTPSSKASYRPSTKWFEISFNLKLHVEVKNTGSKSTSLTRYKNKTVNWTFLKLQPSFGYIKKKLFHIGRKKV